MLRCVAVRLCVPRPQSQSSDARSAKLLKEQFDYTKGWKHVDPRRAVSLVASVKSCIRQLKEKKMAVGERTYSAAISIVGRVGMAKTAEELYEECPRSRGLTGNPSLLNALLQARLTKAKAEDVPEVIRATVAEMHRRRVVPDQYTYNIALKRLAREGWYDLCLGQFQRMEEARILPDRVSYNTLLSASSAATLEDAFQRYQASGITPDARSYSSVIAAYERAGDVEMAQVWLTKAAEEGFAMHQHYLAVLRLLGSRAGDGDGAASEEVAQRMRAQQMPVRGEEYHQIMRAYGANLSAVSRVYSQMDAAGVPRTYRTYTIFLTAITQAMKKDGTRTSEYVALADAAVTSMLQNDAATNPRPYEALAEVYRLAGAKAKLALLRKTYSQIPKFPQPNAEIDRD
eukprot:Rhum_TRINITY_DN21776_c0_g1::Rhum_TRINITY_DN21776_c0_g1_i1::g.174647::m.174647